jgi:hypothetical protein
MKTDFTGIVVDGKLNLSEPVLLPENTTVKVSVVPLGELSPEQRLQNLEELERYCQERQINLGRRWTRDELYDRR